jgi:hypothetical protein
MQKVFLSPQNLIRQKLVRKNFVESTGMLLLTLIALFLLPVMISAQTATSGQIAGSVTDQGGAVVPDALVTITQVETGAKRTINTSEDGNYVFANLPIGVYRLSVTKTGFKETAVSNVVVNVSSVTRQDISLQTGAINEVVNITADTVQIETQSGTVGEVVTGEQVRELPLNGRSFVQLTQLQPGVAPQNNFDPKNKGLFAGVDFSVNGNSAQSNLFLTDGANNNDTGSNRTILLYPSIEAIAEFRMLRNSYGPEYGQAAGSVITIATRGGTNDFHGSVFYFGRNDALNATEFFTNANGLQKSKLRRHDFGFSIGGPIKRDKLFFFYSQEFNKEIRGQSRAGSVPTLLERQGNFSQPRILADGTSCSPGDTRIIPQADLSPAGLSLVKIFPLPNRPASTTTCVNWAESVNSPIDFREENVRIDYNINSKNKIFGRYTQDLWTNASPILYNNLWGDDAYPTIEGSWRQPSRQAAIKLTTELSSTAINDIQFAYSANRIIVNPGLGGDLNTEINTAIPGYFPNSGKVNGINRPHPVFWGGIPPYNYGGTDIWTQVPFRNALDIYTVRDDFSMVKGNHTMKMGFLYDSAAKDEDSGPANEAIQFWGPNACCQNNASWGERTMLVNLLTKGVHFGFAESNTMPVAQNRYKNLEFYFGDTWKVRPNLTLELGARYSIFFEPYDNRDLISSFVPSEYNPARPVTDPCNGLVVPKGTNPCAGIPGATTPTQFENRSLRANNYKNLAPRLGVAWDVFSDGKTAIRAGFGQFFLRERTSPVIAALTTNSPFTITAEGERTLDGSSIILANTVANGRPRFGFSPEAATPYSLQFNVSVGRQLWNDTAVEVGYVGNRARNQLTHFDVNQIKPENQKIAPFVAQPGNSAATNQQLVNNLRPYSNYPSIYIFERSGRANYDSLQLLFRTRFTRNSQLQAAYTFSRSKADFGLSDSSGTTSTFAVLDNNNRDLDFTESDINRPHIFVANMIYNMPEFKGRSAFVRNTLGGWELAAIVQISSGSSLAPRINRLGVTDILAPINSDGQRTSFSAGLSGTGSGVDNLRPIRVEGQPCTIDGPQGTFINPNAFTLVGYKIGETIPQRSTCLGPPTKNVDFSIYKNFTPTWLTGSFLGEGARIQLRLEMFNAFNTTQFRGDSLPLVFYDGFIQCGTAQCSPSNNTITSAGVNGNFGRAFTTKGAREIQYALKLVF